MPAIFKLLREPLVMFSLTAVAVFGLHGLTTENTDNRIEFDAETIAGSLALRQELIGRLLTPNERSEIIDTLIRQEILVREASARGLHLHDSKTRKRLVNQMYFVMTEDAPEPSPAELKGLYETNPEKYMFPESVSFEHVFFETDKAAASAMMDQINAGADVPEDAGDRFWLGNRLEHYTPAQIGTVLGMGFGASLKDLEPGKWTGPIRSGRGWHLVLLEGFTPPQPLPPEELDRILREDWTKAYRARSFQARLGDMRAAYTVTLPSDAEIAATKQRLQTAQAAPEDGHNE
jgi:PPIC-type PPIASE domain